MTLLEIEASLQARLAYLQRCHDEGFERPSMEAWLEVYRTLAQVKQAASSERIADALQHFKRQGIGVESIP
jgi:hypothetical protein